MKRRANRVPANQIRRATLAVAALAVPAVRRRVIQTPVTVIRLAIQAHPHPVPVVAVAAVVTVHVEKNRKKSPRDENIYILINVSYVL